jgi:hypothetical protein
MSKIYLDVKMRVIVDTDINDVDEIMEYVDCYADGDDANVMVLEHEVQSYSVVDAK